jgi:serine/threonine protein kinase
VPTTDDARIPSWLRTHPRFEVIRWLGEGAFGVVVEAIDRETGRAYALKTLRPVAPEERLQLEADFASLVRLEHPNLVPVHALFIEGEHAFFAMDVVSGVDFLTYVRGPLPPPPPPTRPTLHVVFGTLVQEGGVSAYAGCSPAAIVRLRGALRQLAAGVEALHRAGKIHRDLQPENVRVDTTGRLTILDFGLMIDLGPARAASAHDGIVGTAAYIAPEQGDAERVTFASDWYSVGVLLFEALTGALPFSGSAEDVMLRKQSIPAPSPSLLVDGVPEDLERLCKRLLERSPERRAGAAEILEALKV